MNAYVSESRHLTLRSRREMGVNALYAALMNGEVASLNLMELPETMHPYH